MERTGTQTFNMFVPQEAAPSIIRVNLVGPGNTPGSRDAGGIAPFQAAVEDIQLDIWTVGRREIQRIEIPQANLEIVRQQQESLFRSKD